MSPAEPIDDQRLDAIRSLDLAVLLPDSVSWSTHTRERAQMWVRQLAPVLNELLDEIAELDLDLDDAEAEVTRLRRRPATAWATREQNASKPVGVITAVSARRAGPGQWRVSWREDGRRRSRTYGSRPAAESHMGFLIDTARNGGRW